MISNWLLRIGSRAALHAARPVLGYAPPVLPCTLPWLPRSSVTCLIKAASLPFLDENGNDEAQLRVYVITHTGSSPGSRAGSGVGAVGRSFAARQGTDPDGGPGIRDGPPVFLSGNYPQHIGCKLGKLSRQSIG